MNQKINQPPLRLFQEKLFELQEKILAFGKAFSSSAFFIRENPTTPSERGAVVLILSSSFYLGKHKKYFTK